MGRALCFEFRPKKMDFGQISAISAWGEIYPSAEIGQIGQILVKF
jgi:hypothetical protein